MFEIIHHAQLHCIAVAVVVVAVVAVVVVNGYESGRSKSKQVFRRRLVQCLCKGVCTRVWVVDGGGGRHMVGVCGPMSWTSFLDVFHSLASTVLSGSVIVVSVLKCF